MINSTVNDRLKQKRVLIVDDDPQTTNVLSRFLLSCGHTDVQSINDSRHAADAFQDFQPDVVILDVMMPHVSGLELLRSLAKQADAQVRVIMLTAMEDEKTKRMAMTMGACDFMLKPIGPSQLSDRICQVLEQHEQQATS